MTLDFFDPMARETDTKAFVEAADRYLAYVRRQLPRREELSLKQLHEIVCNLTSLIEGLGNLQRGLRAESAAHGLELPDGPVRRGAFGQRL